MVNIKLTPLPSNVVVECYCLDKVCMAARQQVTKGRNFGYRHLGCRHIGFVKQISYGTLTESIASIEPWHLNHHLSGLRSD